LPAFAGFAALAFVAGFAAFAGAVPFFFGSIASRAR
jgi:hypothetical protein